MTRLNPTAQAESVRIRSDEENILAVTEVLKANKANVVPGIFEAPALPTIVTTPFDVEQTRPFFEEMFRKELSGLQYSKEEFDEEFFTRDKFDNTSYKNLETNMDWLGWKAGVLFGYDLWGKKGK